MIAKKEICKTDNKERVILKYLFETGRRKKEESESEESEEESAEEESPPPKKKKPGECNF